MGLEENLLLTGATGQGQADMSWLLSHNCWFSFFLFIEGSFIYLLLLHLFVCVHVHVCGHVCYGVCVCKGQRTPPTVWSSETELWLLCLAPSAFVH